MPRNAYCPRFALSSAFDLTEWAGVQVIDHNGVLITMASSAGLLEDATMALNGHGSTSPNDLLTRLQTASAAAGLPDVWSLGIDSDDRVYFENDTNPFTVTPGAGFDELGFPPVVATASAPLGGSHRATAPGDWVRGEFAVGSLVFTVTTGGGPVIFTVLPHLWVQDVPILLRVTDGTADADDRSLGQSLQAASFNGGQINNAWGIDSDGRVFYSYPLGAGPVTWSSTTFRDRLGFTGAEVAVVDGFRELLTADYPLPGHLYPSRPADDIHPEGETFSELSVQTDGTYSSNYIATHHRWKVTAWLDGPADEEDLSRHLHYACKQYLYGGGGATLYQDWGDSRRSGWRQAYGLLYTPEAIGSPGDQGGYRGRIPGYLTQSFNLQDTTWPERLRRRSPLSFVLAEVP